MGKKNRLGTGLDSLFEDNSVSKEEQAGESTTMVKLSLIEPNKSQPRDRFDDEALGELADSIKENGVLQPILVRPLQNGGYQIVAGERRWRASRLAGLTEVPVFIKELTDRQTMQMALIENIQRQDLTPIEEAKAYKSLMDSYEMTQQQVSEAVGKSRSAVANSLRLLNLDEKVQAMIDRGELSAGHAKVLAGQPTERQYEFATLAANQGMSVRELEEHISAAAEKSERQQREVTKSIRSGSVKKERPFLREFEFAVNNSSNVKVKAKPDSKGGVTLNLKLPKETDTEKLLAKLADILKEY